MLDTFCRARWRRVHGRGGLLHLFHEAAQPCAAKPDIRRPTIEYPGKQRLLEREQRQHAFFDTARGDPINDRHRPLLTDPVHAADALLQHCRIARQIDVDDDRGALQVEANTAGIARQKYATLRIAKPLDEFTAPRNR